MLTEDYEVTATTAAEIDSSGMSRASATKRLREIAKTTNTLTQPVVTELPLKCLTQVKSVFQFRTPLQHHSESHIRELMKAPADSRTLEPVTVWWCAGEWLVVDGHHRIGAYREASWDESAPVPVRPLKGSLDDALLEAARANMLSRLQMNKTERLNGAWKLTLQGDFKGAKLVQVTGVSVRTIANMRATAKALAVKVPEQDLSDWSWGQAMWHLRNDEIPDDDFSGREEAIIQELANVLGKHFGSLPQHKRPLMAQAIERFDRQLPEEVVMTCSLKTLEVMVERKRADMEYWGFDCP